MAVILFSRAMPPIYGQSRSCNAGVMVRSRPFVLNTQCMYWQTYECAIIQPSLRDSIVWTRDPALKRWAEFIKSLRDEGSRQQFRLPFSRLSLRMVFICYF